MQIGTNSIAQTAALAIRSANTAAATASQRISTGLRINSAADDPVGLSQGNRLKTQIASMSKALDNVNLGGGMTQVVDGSLSQISNVLADMYSLAAYDSDNSYYSTMMASYVSEIDTISQNALWNGASLMYGSDSETTTDIQAGPDSGNTISIAFKQMDSTGLSLSASTITASASASSTATAIEAAQTLVSDYQAYMGAMSNIMTYQSDALTSVSTAYSSAYGNLMNADLAQETANLAAAQIRQDGATAMLTQANGMNKEIVAYLLKSVTS